MKSPCVLCYNDSMSRLPAVSLSVAIVLSGCALTGNQTETLPSDAPALTFVQVKTAPESYNGQPVTFGGKVLGARRLKEGTRIEILQLPLAGSLQPTTDLSTSQGRFVALRKEFLDPSTIPAGTFITVTGEMAGSITLPLDETEYSYPLIHVTSLLVWSEPDEEAPRIRRPLGPGSYWGPYWSPYWHPWPYYW